jgi:hypothetical protein
MTDLTVNGDLFVDEIVVDELGFNAAIPSAEPDRTLSAMQLSDEFTPHFARS